jgi:hypothetical protein
MNGSIPYHLFLLFFISSNLEGIQWNGIYILNNYYFAFFLLRFIISSTPMFLNNGKIGKKSYNLFHSVHFPNDRVINLFHSITEYPNNGMKFLFNFIPLNFIPLCFIPLCSILYHQFKQSLRVSFLQDTFFFLFWGTL